MHIEPGLVNEATIVLSYATAAASATYAARLALTDTRLRGAASLAARAGIATVAVFSFFQLLPHTPAGVSEVHLILGSTLFLILGVAPAALGLMAGLLLQGLLFEPVDLPQYGMNVTTLLVPLFALQAVAARFIPAKTAYVDLTYAQTFALSTAYQGGIVAWVAFWAIYGQGFAAANLSQIASFGAAYMLVVLLEPLVDLGVLALAKRTHRRQSGPLTAARLHSAA
jgi:ABC-type Co2+ transport system permease subunit